MYEQPVFVTGEVYHLYNRGVAKQILYRDRADHEQFLLCLNFYREHTPPMKLSTAKQLHQLEELLAVEPTEPLVEILAYCLMPNHFHLVVRQLRDGGISTFMQRVLNSYTRYANTRYRRVGTMYQGTFRAVHVSSDEQLLHLSRYVHLNPYVARLSNDPKSYRWSSYRLYREGTSNRLCQTQFILELAGSSVAYMEFVEDYASYARDLGAFKDLLVDALD